MTSNIKTMAKAIRNYVRDKVFWVWRYALHEGKVDEIVRVTSDIPVEYRFGNFSDIDCMDIEHHEYDAEARQFALDSFESGDRIIVGCYEGRIIFYQWLKFRVMDIHYRNNLPISSNRVYAYKAFTVKDYRGKRVAASSFCIVADYMKQMGYSKVILLNDVRNKYAIKSVIKAGFRPLGSIIKIRVLSNHKCLISNRLSSRLRDEGL